MKKARKLILSVFLAAVLSVSCVSPAFAYTTNGVHLGTNVWYLPWNGFSSLTLNNMVQAMRGWNNYLPDGQRVCWDKVTYTYNNSFPTTGDGESRITKVASSESYVGINKYRYYTSSGSLVESDINLNANFNYRNGAYAGAYDPGTIAGHEFGHSIGLGDTYFDSSQLMYYQARYNFVMWTPGYNDIEGLRTIY